MNDSEWFARMQRMSARIEVLIGWAGVVGGSVLIAMARAGCFA